MRKTLKLSLPNLRATAALAQRLKSEITNYLLRHHRLIIVLKGELGSGKTTLAQAIARQLGVKTRVKSPTFVLWQIHPFVLRQTSLGRTRGKQGKLLKKQQFWLHHLDFYRLDRKLEMLKLVKYILRSSHSLVVIEWGEKIEQQLPPGKLIIQLAITGQRSRNVQVTYDV